MVKVLVTGANGYLGGHILKQLIEGGYQVVATLRDIAKAEPFIKAFPNAPLYFVPFVGINDPTAYDSVFAEHPDISKVIHTASPSTLEWDIKDVQTAMYDAAVNGNLYLMEKVHALGTVDKIVITSSYAAQAYTLPDKQPGTPALTEESWSNLSPDRVDPTNLPQAKYDAYWVAKLMAERAAWQWMDKHKGSAKFSLHTITAPTFFGAYALPTRIENVNPMLQYLASFLDMKDPESVRINKTIGAFFINVRNVAEGHVKALQRPESSRWAVYAGHYTLQWLVQEAKTHLPKKYADRLPATDDNDPEYVADRENLIPLNNSRTNAESNIQYVSLADTAVETFKFLADMKDSSL